jgi:hypothetical protein
MVVDHDDTQPLYLMSPHPHRKARRGGQTVTTVVRIMINTESITAKIDPPVLKGADKARAGTVSGLLFRVEGLANFPANGLIGVCGVDLS